MIEALHRILDHWVELVILTCVFLAFVRTKKYIH